MYTFNIGNISSVSNEICKRKKYEGIKNEVFLGLKTVFWKLELYFIGVLGAISRTERKWKQKAINKTQDISLERHTNGQKVYEKNVQHNESLGKFRSRPLWDIT